MCAISVTGLLIQEGLDLTLTAQLYLMGTNGRLSLRYGLESWLRALGGLLGGKNRYRGSLVYRW